MWSFCFDRNPSACTLRPSTQWYLAAPATHDHNFNDASQPTSSSFRGFRVLKFATNRAAFVTMYQENSERLKAPVSNLIGGVLLSFLCAPRYFTCLDQVPLVCHAEAHGQSLPNLFPSWCQSGTLLLLVAISRAQCSRAMRERNLQEARSKAFACWYCGASGTRECLSVFLGWCLHRACLDVDVMAS